MSNHFSTIEKAIDFIRENLSNQPSLEEIASEVGLSTFHFQRIFSEWVGVSPKKFMQYLTLERAKSVLGEQQLSLFAAADELGLSGTGRLHDLFVNIEGMTPGEYKNGGENLRISYNVYDSPFGNLVIASTSKGICHISFVENLKQAEKIVHEKFANAKFQHEEVEMHRKALAIFSGDWSQLEQIKLHLKGTDFQLKVWQALLSIPSGQLTTYSTMATCVGNPKASRAVGTAVGQNPIAYLIPCHRVIQSTGNFGQYHWGATRKAAMIGWEAVKEIK